MTNKKDVIIIYCFILFELFILFNSKLVIKSVILSSKIFILKIFPSLMPTMVIGLILVKLNIDKIIPYQIKKIFNIIFNFNDAETTIFLTSVFTGTPSNASFINEYLEKGIISEKSAESLLCCTHFINPLFVIGGVGIGVFKNYKIGMFILFIMFLSNAIKAFILRKNFNSKIKTYYEKEKNKSLISIFIQAIKTSMTSLLTILAIVILFNILLSLITNIFDIEFNFQTILNIFLEMTSAVNKISVLKESFITKFFLSYYSLSFGGLCIIFQTISMFENKKIKYFKYLIFRLF